MLDERSITIYDYIFRLFPYWSKDWQWLRINFESVLTTSKDWHFRSAPPTDCSSSKTWSSMVLFYLFSLQKETLISSAWMNNLLEKNIKMASCDWGINFSLLLATLTLFAFIYKCWYFELKNDDKACMRIFMLLALNEFH